MMSVLSTLPVTEALALLTEDSLALLTELKRCCHSDNWARGMLSRRPYTDQADLLSKAKDVWYRLEPGDWLQAFAAHPRIGDDHAEASNKLEQSTFLTEASESGIFV